MFQFFCDYFEEISIILNANAKSTLTYFLFCISVQPIFTASAPLCSEGDEQNLFWFCRLLTWPKTKAQTCRSIRAAGAAHPFVMKLQIFGFVLLAHCACACDSVCVCVRYGNEAVHRARAWLGEQQQREGGREVRGQCNNVVNSSNYTRRWGSPVRQLSLCCGRRGNWQWSHNGDWEATVRMSVISCSNSNGSGSGSVDSVWSVRLKFSIKVQFIDLTSVIRHNNSARLSLFASLSLALRQWQARSAPNWWLHATQAALGAIHMPRTEKSKPNMRLAEVAV